MEYIITMYYQCLKECHSKLNWIFCYLDIEIILQIIQRSDLKNMDFQKLEPYGTMK